MGSNEYKDYAEPTSQQKSVIGKTSFKVNRTMLQSPLKPHERHIDEIEAQ